MKSFMHKSPNFRQQGSACKMHCQHLFQVWTFVLFCLSVTECFPVCLSLTECLPVCLSVTECLPVCLSVCLYLSKPRKQSASTPFHSHFGEIILSIYLSVCLLSVCLSWSMHRKREQDAVTVSFRCRHLNLSVYAHTCMHAPTCLHVTVYVFTFIFTHKHTHIRRHSRRLPLPAIFGHQIQEGSSYRSVTKAHKVHDQQQQQHQQQGCSRNIIACCKRSNTHTQCFW